MINCFVIRSDDSSECVESLEGIRRVLESPYRSIWIDLESPDEETLGQIGALFDLDPEAIEDCLHGEQHPRVDEFENHIFVVLYGVVANGETLSFSPRKLAAFCNGTILITVHREPVRTVQIVRARCKRQPAHVLGRGTGHVLFTLIDGVVDNFALVGENFDERLDSLEVESLDPLVEETILSGVTELRRDVLQLRRIAVSQRELLLPFAQGEFEFFGEKYENRFAHVRDHLTQCVDMVENLRELLNGVRDNYHAALSNRSNEVMKTLTIFASLFMPMSLLAGIYGMNTVLWPDVSRPSSFWYIVGSMGIVVVAMILFFRSRKWF